MNLSLYSPSFPPLVDLSAAHSGALDLAAPLPGVIPSVGGSGSGLSTSLSASPLPDPSPAWLAELLGVTPAPATAPLVLASALPPIPGRAVEKISKGHFIDFKELLNDNVALVSQLRELGAVVSSASSRSRLHEVTDPLTWVYCYLSFMAVLSLDARVRNLVAYAQIFIQLARSHKGSGWLAYDRQFCQQLAAGTALKWNKINPSLLSVTVLGSRVDAIALYACRGTTPGLIALWPACSLNPQIPREQETVLGARGILPMVQLRLLPKLLGSLSLP